MAGYIEDRWLKKRPNKATGKRERTPLYGKCTRYRVKGIPGVADRSFDTAEDAKTWLALAQTDSKRGNYIDPRRGGITSAITLRSTGSWPSSTPPRPWRAGSTASGSTCCLCLAISRS